MKSIGLLVVAICTIVGSGRAESQSATVTRYLHNVASDETAMFTRRVDPEADRRLATAIQCFPLPQLDGGRSIILTFGHAVGIDRQIHMGIDIAAPIGTAVLAVGNGTIVMAGYGEDLGNYMVIDHGNSLITLYAHLSSIVRNRGAVVRTGDRIGYSGITGLVTDEVLHFAIIYQRRYTDPATILRRFGQLRSSN